MNHRRIISILALIMAIIMIVTLVISVLPSKAYAVEQSEIDELERQKEALAERVNEAKDRLTGLQDEQGNVLEQKAALDEEKRAAEAAIAIVDKQLAVYDLRIAEKAIEVQQAKAIEDQQLQRYRMRIRAMEEDGSYSYLAILLQSKTLGELLTAIDDIGEIMESDKALERQYRAAREECEKVKAEYEKLRADCEEQQAELLQEKEEIERQIQEADDTLAALKDEIDAALQEYEESEAAEEAAEQELQALIEAYNEQKRREEEERQQQQQNQSTPAPQPTQAPNPSGGGGGNSGGGGGSSGGGGNTPAPTPYPTPTPAPSNTSVSFVWPVPCSMRITSRFGNRVDPFTGETRYHSGIDIDGFNNDGNSIVAAAAGTVVYSTYNDGYGNYVLIDHGNGYMTLYAHMQSAAVSAGQSVSQGQTIGYLGHTGRATGTHCHFEVRKDGTQIDPEQFFSGMTYWNC